MSECLLDQQRDPWLSSVCQLPWTPSKKLGIFLIYLLHQASGMPPSLPTYRFHTPPPLPFIHSCSASHYLYLKFRSRLSHQKHMLAAYLCMCGAYRSCRVHASVGTCDLKHTDSHYFTLKADTWVHCEMGPRCTPEIPESRARMHVVLSRTARSQEFRLSSQACLSDWSGSEPMTGPALRNSKSTLLLIYNQVAVV